MGQSLSINTKVNLAGMAVILILGMYYVYQLTHPEEIKACSSYYPSTVSLNLKKRDGELISSATLQSRSSSQDWGLIDKLQVEIDKKAPVQSIFEVGLKKDDINTVFNKKGGAGFPWRPSRLNGATSVCFAYNVWLSEGFDFTAGGILPGVASDQVLDSENADEDEDGELVRHLRAHPGWSDFGRIQFLAYDPTNKNDGEMLVLDTRTDLVPGRWHKLEQELVLNDEGQSNGKVRLWLDGKLIIDESSVALTKSKSVKFDTALYHISHGTPFGHGNVELKKDAMIRISPMELSWK